MDRSHTKNLSFCFCFCFCFFTSFITARNLLIDEHDKKYLSSCYICYICPKECYVSPPPAPSLPPDSKNDHPMTIILILMLSVLAAAFLFLSYLTVTKYRSRYPEITLTDGSVLDHPIWYIRTVGLPRSTIDSISIVKYSKSIGNNDCSVCLSEFQENQMLRLLPKCGHAFHVPCIDTWLTSHKNCPVCRAPILIDTEEDQDQDQAANESATDEAGAENQLASFKLDSRNIIPTGLSDLDLNADSERRSVSVNFSSDSDEGCSDVNMGGKRKNSGSMEGVS